MKRLKAVILISGYGSTLQAIIDKCSDHLNIQCVISDRFDAYGITRARNAGIITNIIAQGEHETRDKYSGRLGRHVAASYPDIVILAGFMKFLKPSYFEVAPTTINIHPSLLPKYKGLDTYQRVLSSGDNIHGFTIHKITEELDSGPLIYQKEISIKKDDTVKSLEERVKCQEQIHYPWVINEIAKGNFII